MEEQEPVKLVELPACTTGKLFTTSTTKSMAKFNRFQHVWLVSNIANICVTQRAVFGEQSWCFCSHLDCFIWLIKGNNIRAADGDYSKLHMFLDICCSGRLCLMRTLVKPSGDALVLSGVGFGQLFNGFFAFWPHHSDPFCWWSDARQQQRGVLLAGFLSHFKRTLSRSNE